MADHADGFSLPDLYAALDAQRTDRGLTWTGVAREVSRRFTGPTRSVSSSTITGIRTHAVVEGDGVLQMLVWLERAPEDFVAGHPLAGSPSTTLPIPADGQVLRWDAAALRGALDAARTERGMTWAALAAEVGCAPGNLTGMKPNGRVTLPFVMRPVAWIGRPAADFTHLTPW